MIYTIIFNIELNENSLTTIKFAINYYSTHPRPGLDSMWINPINSSIIFDYNDKIIFLDESDTGDEDSWDPSIGDDISEFLIPFVKKGEISYEDLNNSRTVIRYSGNNKATNSMYIGNTLQEDEYEFEYVWKLADFPIVNHLILSHLIQDSKQNKTVNIPIIEQEFGLTDEIFENVLYSILGRGLIKGTLDTSTKLFNVEETIKFDEQIKVCSICFEKIVSDDKFCGSCGNPL